MQADLADTVGVAEASEGPDQVARLDWAAGAGREDESGLRPGGSEPGAVGVLGCAPGRQSGAGQAEQGDIASTSSGLHGADMKLAIDALELLPDMQEAALQVDVVPGKPQHLAASHAVEQQQHERGIERVIGAGGEEGGRFRRRPWLDCLRCPARQLDKPGDVAGDEFFPDGSGRAMSWPASLASAA